VRSGCGRAAAAGRIDAVHCSLPWLGYQIIATATGIVRAYLVRFTPDALLVFVDVIKELPATLVLRRQQ